MNTNARIEIKLTDQAEAPRMFCNQCEQTTKGVCCVKIGTCGERTCARSPSGRARRGVDRRIPLR